MHLQAIVYDYLSKRNSQALIVRLIFIFTFTQKIPSRTVVLIRMCCIVFNYKASRKLVNACWWRCSLINYTWIYTWSYSSIILLTKVKTKSLKVLITVNYKQMHNAHEAKTHESLHKNVGKGMLLIHLLLIIHGPPNCMLVLCVYIVMMKLLSRHFIWK